MRGRIYKEVLVIVDIELAKIIIFEGSNVFFLNCRLHWLCTCQ